MMMIDTEGGQGQPVMDQSSTQDFLVILTSDLIVHTAELSASAGSESKTSPQQIKLISSHNCRNDMQSNKVPQLKKVISSSIMRDERGEYVCMILFESYQMLLVRITNLASSDQALFQTSQGQDAFKPIVEMTTLCEFDVHDHRILVDVAASTKYIYKVEQNQPQPGNDDTTHG